MTTTLTNGVPETVKTSIASNVTGRVFRSKVPLRMSFAGGGTDVPPYPQTHGGAVLCAAIDKFAYASLVPTGSPTDFEVQSLDYDIVAKYKHDDDLEFDGKLDLVKAALRRLNGGHRGGGRLFLHSDAPPD